MYLQEAQTMGDILQRLFAKYGDDSGLLNVQVKSKLQFDFQEPELSATGLLPSRGLTTIWPVWPGFLCEK